MKWNGERHGLDLDPASIVISDGVYPGIIAALRSFVPIGNKVLLTTPAYSGFYSMARAARVDTVDSVLLTALKDTRGARLRQRVARTALDHQVHKWKNVIGHLPEHYSRNVKRWRGGQLIQRWVASALVEAEKRFRRVRGYRDLQHLVGALDALAPPDGMVVDVA